MITVNSPATRRDRPRAFLPIPESLALVDGCHVRAAVCYMATVGYSKRIVEDLRAIELIALRIPSRNAGNHSQLNRDASLWIS